MVVILKIRQTNSKITAECTENQKEKKFVFFQLFAKKGHPPAGDYYEFSIISISWDFFSMSAGF